MLLRRAAVPRAAPGAARSLLPNVAAAGKTTFRRPRPGIVKARALSTDTTTCDDAGSRSRRRQPEKMSLIDRFVSYLSTDNWHVVAEAQVHSISKHIVHEDWARCCGLKGTLMNETQLKAIHVWIIHQRIKRDHPDFAPEILHHLYEQIWTDLDNHMYKNGRLFLNKHLKEAQSAIYGSLRSYDVALGIYEDENGKFPALYDKNLGMGNQDFLGCLWRNLYEADPELDKNHLVQMRDYIMRELQQILDMDKDDFYLGFLSWGPVPSTPPTPSIEAQRLSAGILKRYFDGTSEDSAFHCR